MVVVSFLFIYLYCNVYYAKSKHYILDINCDRQINGVTINYVKKSIIVTKINFIYYYFLYINFFFFFFFFLCIDYITKTRVKVNNY